MGTPRPVLVYSTQGVLTGCQLARVALLCLFETATTPGRIVRFDLRRRTMKTLFDPNPHLSVVRIGHTQRLFAKTTFDIEAFGDLVLPPDHRPGQRHPLIIVQYSSRGFLRGGTGDEFPIQPLAAAGMAVLSFQRPRDYVVEGARQLDDLTHAEQKDWGDRRNVQSALDQLIDQAVATGTIDESRMGLTGLSDGASTAQFALLNGRMQYKAVSLASCCEDEATFTALGGPALADGRKVSGYPAWGDVVDPWRIYSLSRNAARLTTPMLLQLADSEYLLSLESVRALNAERAMVDLFVFPDERHIKWQPAHRLAIYRRNIDWFAFWLQDARPSFAEGASHFARWDAMRQGLPSRPGCVEGAC
jgi:dipeptidyl aminopeptidase/acylaminoacyl peptidase